MSRALDLGMILLLTALTQIGGLAWLIAAFTKRRLVVFVVTYAAFTLAAPLVAPAFGRTALSCRDDGALQVQSWVYCALNRTYVTPELAQVLRDAAQTVSDEHPGTITLVLDANFPFFDGFPLLPHLSHDDGAKADLAFYYSADGAYLPGRTRSPIGYFAFENGPAPCPKRWLSLRWDMGWLQPLWPNYALDTTKLRSVLEALITDPRVGKILLEPHLQDRLGIADGKLRFQGCRAARHDDHIHLQL